jgi:hypothetical protein
MILGLEANEVEANVLTSLTLVTESTGVVWLLVLGFVDIDGDWGRL